jgi:hypothetical protein
MILFWNEFLNPVLKCQRVGHNRRQETRNYGAYPPQVPADAIAGNFEYRHEICQRCKIELLPWELLEQAPSANHSATYEDIATAPRDGTRIDLWLVVEPSPRAIRTPQSLIVPNCWYESGAWVHRTKNKIEPVHAHSIVGWRSG